MKALLLTVALCAVQFVSAQIRIISQDAVRKAADIEVAESSLQFKPQSVDFGTIDEMSGVWHGSAKHRNSGAETLAITQIKSSDRGDCGCFEILPSRPRRASSSASAYLYEYFG